MKASYRVPIMAALLTCTAGTSEAYEPPTHADISKAAVNQSNLQRDPALLRNIGLDKGPTDTTQRFQNSRGQARTISELIQDGAVFEDNAVPLLAFTNHFYNPISGKGLDLPLLPTRTPSPLWALTTPQEGSYITTRQFYLDALTAGTKFARDRAWGRTFETLGHVVHHIQDMAQPQHVRNDVHCPYLVLCATLNFFSPSLYEKWTDDSKDTLPLTLPASYDLNDTLFMSTFSSARRFWNTAEGQSSVTEGKGIAEYTNRNFLSAGTNFGSGKGALFPSPAFEINNRLDIDIKTLCAQQPALCPNPNLQGIVTFFGNTVVDKFTEESGNNQYASALSIFSPDLRNHTGTGLGLTQLYTLNTFTMAAAHKYLIPRAVAYSAGLINYFFRGKLEVEGKGATQILVKNASKEAMKGDFGLYYDDAQDVRRPVAITACSVSGADVPVVDGKCKGAALVAANPDPGMPLQITFTQPTDSAQKVSGEYMVVFSGELGEEKAGDGNIGAVVAKQIRTIGGALYISGRDNQGRQVFLRADAAGTKVLIPGDGQFNPLLTLTPQNLQKAYSMRQVRFLQTGPGIFSYEPLALTIGNTEFGSRGTGSLVKNASTNTFDNVGAGESWLAKSSTPEVGEFTFRVVLTSTTTGALQYTRRYRGADGTQASETGVIALPPLGQRNMNYLGFGAGKLHVSSNGSTVSGLKETLNPLTAAGAWINYDLVISLALPPEVRLVEKSRDPLIATQAIEPFSVQILGPFSTTARCDPNAPTLTRELVAEVYREKRDSSQRQTMLIGYLNNNLASYQLTSIGTGQILGERITGIVPGFGQGAACDAIGSWIRRQGKGNVYGQSYSEKRATFRDGALTYSRRILGIQEALGSTFTNMRNLYGSDINRIWDYSYEGGALFAPPFEFKSLEVSDVTTGNDFAIVWALTDKLADAIVRPFNTSSTIFRSIDITGKSYIADASPLGEVFFATTDRSIVIHEPKGNTPRVVIPPNVVQLLAAVWF